MARHRVGVLISGRGSNMAALIDAARDPACPFEVVIVASDRPDAPGLDQARRQGIATVAQSPKGMAKPDYEAIIERALHDAGVETIALAGYMRLLSDDFVARWRGRIVNIHPSLLPRHKGLDTHARAIAAGDGEAGCSVHLVTEQLDGGAVLAQARIPVLPDDTPDSLAARVLAEEHRLYPKVLAKHVMRKSPDQPAILERLRALALALPAAAEKLSHGSPCFFVEKGRAFAYLRDGHHGDGETAVLVRTSGREEQAMLVEGDPAFYFIPAYLGPSGWVAMRVGPPDTDWNHVGDRVAASWEMAAPRRLLEMGGR